MEPIVRSFAARDTEAVVRLWTACGLTRPWNDPRRDIERKLTTQPELFLVMELDGEIIGSAMAGYDGHRGSVYYLAVAPAHQGNGYGRVMMQRVEALLMERGCPKMNIMIRRDNESVIGFYRENGYTEEAVAVVGKRMIPDD